MNENETLEWLNFGIDIGDELANFREDGRKLTQMDIKDLKLHMSMESVLKVTKAISKASERDMQKFNFSFAEVLRVNELPPNESILKRISKSTENVEESIISLFGDKFNDDLKKIKRELWDVKWKKMQKDFCLNEEDMLVYLSFLKCIDSKEYSSKIFLPFISGVPASFLKAKDFFVRVLSILRKLSIVKESTYDIKANECAEYFKDGEIYVFPSFVLGTKFNEDGKIKKENETILRISGKTNRGHFLINDFTSKKSLFIFYFIHFFGC